MRAYANQANVIVIPPTAQSLPGSPRTRKLRVAAYCRVSTEKDEQLNSFEVQVSYYTDKIGSTPEWELAGIYTDEGITGTSMKKRDGFKKMLRICRDGRIDLILVKSVSRFGRNIIDVMRTVRALQSRGVGIIFEKESIDTRHMNSEMMLAFHSAFSQSESESISENVRWGKSKAYEQGKVDISSKTFGFCEGPDKTILIDPVQGEAVRNMGKWLLDGASLNDICALLENKDISSPSGGTKWYVNTVKAILTNVKYKGDVIRQQTYKSSLFTDRVKNDGIVPMYYFQDVLPRIFEPEYFDRIQEELALRDTKRPTTEKAKTEFGRYSGKYALSSLLICGECGAFYRRTVWHRKRITRAVWRCCARLDKADNCKNSPTIDEIDLQTSIMRAIAAQYINREIDTETAMTSIRHILSPNTSDYELAVRSRISALGQKKNEIITKCLEEVDASKYDTELASIMKEREALKGQLAGAKALAKKKSITDARLQEISAVLDKFKSTDLSYDDILVRKIVNTIEVQNENTIEITFKDGQKSLANL